MLQQIKDIRLKLPSDKSAESNQRRSDLFKQFDPNNNGYLSLAEVDKGIRDVVNLEGLFNSKKVIFQAFKAAQDSVHTKSSHGQDYIERPEFRLLFVYLEQYYEYWIMFDEIDTSDDKRISLEEFSKAIPLMKKFGLVIQDPKQEFQKIDTNHGGFILFDEFVNYAIHQSLHLNNKDQ